MSRHLVYASQAMREIDRDVADVARSEVNVLLAGASGVGKDVVARLIHERSDRRGPFVRIDCATVPVCLANALFGRDGEAAKPGGRS